mgnify:CR=1 FL=1
MRIALGIEYDGAPFYGFQTQKQEPTVQSSLEAAISQVANHPVKVFCAGRTDTGVSAACQVVHFDSSASRTERQWTLGINTHLHKGVGVLWAKQVSDDFHARFSALERRYLFRVLVRRPPATHQAGRVWQVKKPLDIDRMREAATHLIGEHDFTTFRSTICQAQTPVKTLDRVDMTEHPVGGGVEVQFDVRARSFLHNQVRSIVGTLERVGAGSFAPDDVKQMLAARDRQACGPVAPPQGLYLSHVTYETDPFAQSSLRRG